LKLSVNPELWDEALATNELNLHAEVVEAVVKGDPAAAECAVANLIDTLRTAIVAPADPQTSARRA